MAKTMPGKLPLQEAPRACQGSNTTIYAFYAHPHPPEDSAGPKNLRDLASGTGGRVFSAADGEEAILHDLTTIESEARKGKSRR